MQDNLNTFLNGWSCIKFNNTPHDVDPVDYAATAATKNFSDIDWPLIRLGEIHLIYAEACMHVGGSASAQVAALASRAGVAAPKEITEEWLKDPKPYERMIKEMKALADGVRKDGSYERREARLKLTAAEWLLVNNENMMIEDPEDPLNPIPNWGNRYWKAITETREALGIDKHTSMRDMIQAEYAAAAKSVKSLAYNTRQFYDHIIDPKAREAYDFDSLENQKMEFATISAANGLAVKNAEKRVDSPERKADAPETEEKRVREPVESQNEAKLMKNAVKNYKDFIVGNEKTASLKGPDQSR
jgi:hypothetical protein